MEAGGAAVGPIRPTAVEIDLAALIDNAHAIARLADASSLWAVVKADAYGHGVDAVAEAAIATGVKRLCVATLSEAWHLRQSAGVRVPILIMGPLDGPSLRRAGELDASVTVLSMDMVESLAAIAPARRGRPLRVHLKVDTGMGRWGVPLDAVSTALDRIAAIEGVELEGVMTHFATADEDDRTFFDSQLANFEDVVATVRQRHSGVIAHAANSAAIVTDPRAHFDAVRCGVAMYGLSPLQADPEDLDLKPVLSLRSYVADVRRRMPGESVGYCRTFIADSECLVAEVPIGYADGVRRGLSNQAEALVNGRRHRFVGNVSMDHLSLLVDEGVSVGDTVTVLGRDGDERVTAEEHAHIVDTINYEITCGVATEPRLRRTHVSGD